MTLAPIILFAYNRPWHTEQTLVALSQNYLAEKSSLYVFCDGPKENATQEEVAEINKVRTLVAGVAWSKEVRVVEQVGNLGLATSVIEGVSKVLDEHGKVIVLEDDIITGKGFLTFMNEALNLYEDKKTVFGISGYSYPSTGNIDQPTYFLPISSSWSYATWANRWDKVNFDSIQLKNQLDHRKLKDALNFGNYPYYEMLENQINSKNDSWAIRFYVSMFLENGYFLYPNKSLVKNIGFDNSGTHCKDDNFFSIVDYNTKKIPVEEIEVRLDKRLVNLVKERFENKQNKKSNSNSPKKILNTFKSSIKRFLKL